jgi:hypothetical protein
MSKDNDGDNNNSDDDNDGDSDDDNDGDNDDNTDWRQVTKGRRAVTHTDERQVTPVRNQFQGLSEHQEDQEDPTPRLAPRELIEKFSRPPEDDNAKTGSIGSTDTQEDDNAETGSIGSTESFDTQIPPEDNDGDNSNNDDNTKTGSIGSTGSFDSMTDITNDYGCLIEIIRLVNAKQAKVYNGKKKNYADIVKFREVLGSALSKQPCSGTHGGYSWLVDTEEDYTYRVGAKTRLTNKQDRDHAPQLLPTAAPQQTNGEHGPSGATPMAPT